MKTLSKAKLPVKWKLLSICIVVYARRIINFGSCDNYPVLHLIFMQHFP